MTRHHLAEFRAVVAALAIALGIAGCATHSGDVVLLPSQDGHTSSLVVTEGNRQVVLDKPYAAAELTSRGPRAYAANPADIRANYAPALSAQPGRPQQYTLYFLTGTDEFTEDSKRILESVLDDIARHQVPDIVVIGHTDSVGSATANDTLSRQRADTVRSSLIGRGIAGDSIVAVGRGKREPVVPTADGVEEPRNRRVDILVR